MVRRWIYLLYLILLLIVIYGWLKYAAPLLTCIPNDFNYTANILSLDNFYNDELKKFEGEQISKTLFNYQVSELHPDYLIVKGIFDVKKFDNTKIFSVSRNYFVDPVTGMHKLVAGSANREGYLFSPRFLDKSSFKYWHVNYNAPAVLIFSGEDSIDGLKIYHYKSKFSADQTEDLSYLSNVPESRGIKTVVNLDIWFEPITGWLVKYTDDAIAYYYDKTTGHIISPWNKFSNRYTESSASEQAKYAHYLKWKVLFVYVGVPALFVFLFFICLFIDSQRTNKSSFIIHMENRISLFVNKINFAYVTTILLITFMIGSGYYVYSYQKKQSIYTIGISRWNDSPWLYEAIRGFKDGLAEYGYIEGKNIKFIIKDPNSNIENQIAIIQSFVKNHVDLIYTLTTPGTLVAKGIVKNIPVVFSDVTYPVESNIISTNGDHKSKFVGSRNYIIPAEQYYDFDKLFPDSKVIGFVHKKGDPDSTISYNEYQKMLNKRGVSVVEISALDLNDLKSKLKPPINYDALYLACDTLMRDGGSKIVAEFSKTNKIPSFSCAKESIFDGALVGYVADLYVIGKIAGRKAALILRGAEPYWLQTVPPERGYLIINKITADRLGIAIPPEMFNHADYVIK